MAQLSMDQFQAKVDGWPKRGRAAVLEGMKKVGREVLAYAQRNKLEMSGGVNLPRAVGVNYVGQVLHMRSGNLTRSLSEASAIKSDIKGNDVVVEVGTNLTNKGHPYPRYHEYGSPGGMIPERSWLRSSIKAKRKRLKDEVRARWVAAYG